VFVSVLILCPLGILLGMPFPSGLRIIGEEAQAFGFKAVLVVAANSTR